MQVGIGPVVKILLEKKHKNMLILHTLLPIYEKRAKK
jgi:hypothetical protein